MSEISKPESDSSKAQESISFYDLSQDGSRDRPQGEHQPPSDVANLIDKERIADKGQGPKLTDREQLHVSAWRAFPDRNDEEYRQLLEKRNLADKKIGPELTDKEQAKLSSKLGFRDRNDEEYRQLLEKRYLADKKIGPELTEKEQALLSKGLSKSYGESRREK